MSPPDCLAKPKAWLRPEAGPLADFLGGEERLEDRLELVGGDAGAGIGHRDRDEIAAAGGLGAQRRDGATLRTPIVSWPSPSMASRPLTARLIIAVSNCAMSAIAKQSVSDQLDLDADPAADQRTNQLRHGVDLVADIEDLRLQRLAAGECQQLRGQLRGALHGFGDRVDIAAAALFRQFAAAQEVGRGADDGQADC